MKRSFYSLYLLLALLLAACNIPSGPPATPVPLPPAAPDFNDVPQATLSNSAGESQAGIPGTRCWGGGCVDMVGIIAPDEPLRVSAGETLTFNLGAGDPSSANLQVREWLPSDMQADQGTIIAFDAPTAASGDLAPSATIEWEVPVEPGEYALNLMTFYQTGDVGGDISYGWHIIVE
jgi:hypothetical protein